MRLLNTPRLLFEWQITDYFRQMSSIKGNQEGQATRRGNSIMKICSLILAGRIGDIK